MHMAGYNAPPMTGLRFDHISRNFGGVHALEDVHFTIAPGELFFLLGPSGCGKSTLLRIAAGLLKPSMGRIFFDGRDVTDVETRHRNAVMVFQSYALWPHMSVRQNVQFGLSVKGTAADEARRRVDAALELVRLSGEGNRKPFELSGGQQQRVALARALAVRPACLLLDEPLSNLDAKLRVQMRGEIRRICKESGLTTVYVTHDQKEALSVADRIAVMDQGRVRQMGTPAELYNDPIDTFVADFIGGANLLKGEVVGRDGPTARVRTGIGELVTANNARLIGEKNVVVSIRPEQMRIGAAGLVGTSGGNGAAHTGNRFVGKVVDSTFLGEASEHTIEIGGARVRALATPPMFNPPEQVTLSFDAADVQMLAEPAAGT
jgi:iron(III) transport system ATP-binding protein